MKAKLETMATPSIEAENLDFGKLAIIEKGCMKQGDIVLCISEGLLNLSTGLLRTWGTEGTKNTKVVILPEGVQVVLTQT